MSTRSKRHGARVMIAGARRDVIRILMKAGLDRSTVDYATSVVDARKRFARQQAAETALTAG